LRGLVAILVITFFGACAARERAVPYEVSVAPPAFSALELPTAKATNCGNGVIDDGERCDGSLGLPGLHVACYPDGALHPCDWDFSSIQQLYCNGTCSWGGPDGCDQEDADIYCRLVTANSHAYATNFKVATPLSEPGFACLGEGYGKNLGPIREYGVNVDVHYQDTNLAANHGQGSVVLEVVCQQ